MTDDRIAAEVTVLQPVTVLDISADGVHIEASFALQNDSLHEFRLTLRERSVVVKGRIVRCEAELHHGQLLYRWTVEFVEPTPHALLAINDFAALHRTPPIIDGEIS